MTHNGAEKKPISLYLHIPFCRSKCKYCSFFSEIHNDVVVNRYIEILVKEVRSFFANANPPYSIQTVYIGGGTPSRIPHDLMKIFLKDSLSLDESQPAEITIEVNPCDVKATLLTTLKDSGVNRVSMGVQSFNDDVLSFLGRRHNANDARIAFKTLVDSGFKNISIDLIHGVPGFGIERWENDLYEAIRLHPSHISLYSLSIEEGTPLYSQGIHKKLDPDFTADEYHLAVRKLRDAGYVRYEISNFAKPGFECKHNLNYWNLGDYIGFGPGAGSYLNNAYFERIQNLETYIANADENLSTVEFEEKFDNNSSFVNAMIMGLRLEKGINLVDFETRFGINPIDAVHEQWGKYIDGKHVIVDDDSLRFGDEGIYISNSFLSMLV